MNKSHVFEEENRELSENSDLMKTNSVSLFGFIENCDM
jgi:hypothetical protein